ncbi:MAG: hypothetical protein L0221_10830, partial [Chloroflexi bacterium]|nr:hypothetical protein [Chloroflexota bacterium]
MTDRLSRLVARAAPLAAVLGAGVIAPAGAAAHQLSATYESRLPLAVYLAGAAAAVALSFAFVLLRDVRATPAAVETPRHGVPGWLRIGLRALGLVAWLWIVVQGLFGGGATDADVTRLFLWVYGWVGVALVCAFVGPLWRWLDPFSTLHELFARGLRAAGVGSLEKTPLPESIGRWPAVVGFAAVVWLELVAQGGGSATLFVVVVGYTFYTLAMMAQFGRDDWRSRGEVFGVWFDLLGRLAPFAPVDDGDVRVVRRRPFASGVLEPGWRREDLVLVALGVGSILFDGLSQTAIWVGIFGVPNVAAQTALLVGFMGVIVVLALAVSRLVGVAATGAGLLPIAVGYLLAHYLTYLLIEGQRIMIAISDPLKRGDDLFGTAFW